MTKLIRADLARMFKTKPFWICGAICVVSVFGNFLLRYFYADELVQFLGNCAFVGSFYITEFAAVFSALFLGADYSNGTIRNKMTVGHGRRSIYFSNLITSSICGLIYAAASRLPVLIFGLLAGSRLGMGGIEFAFKIVVMLTSTISVSSLFTLAGTLISSKSLNVVVTLAGVIALLFGSGIFLLMLGAPEYTFAGYIIEADGSIQPTEKLNPFYLHGAMRVFIRAVCDVLPTGQIIQLELGNVHAPELMPLYSVVFTAAVSSVGTVVFRRKDLK